MDCPDANAPSKTRRRLWWRALVLLVIIFLVLPIATWVAIDQIGKAEWRRVQEEMRALGAPTSFEELNLPTQEGIPDEENFGALPFFQKAGMSRPPREFDYWLTLMKASWHFSDKENNKLASGKAMLGIAAEPEAMASELRAYTQQKSLLEEWPELENSYTDEQSSDTLAWWDHQLQPVWQEIDAARGMQPAFLLPLNSELIARNTDRPPAIYHNKALSAALNLAPALRGRALGAIQRGDWESAIRCIELLERLGTLFANQLGDAGATMSDACYTLSLVIFIQCSWHKSWRSNDEYLARCQKLFETWDISTQLVDGFHSQLLVWVENLRWAKENRSYTDSIAGHAGEAMWLKIAPSGWYDLNIAYALDMSLRHVHQPLYQKDFRKLSHASADMAEEISNLGRLSKMNLAWGAHPFERTGQPKLLRPPACSEAFRRMAITVCAIERFRNRHDGQLPATLKALTPDYLASLPIDPIDGKPLRYQLNSDDSQATYHLWSIGIDGQDDFGEVIIATGGPQLTPLESLDYDGDWTWPSIQRSWDYYENPTGDE